ncbi:MAG: hypothetical protein RLZZ621_567 [Gemmatimonadota bacterium]
MTSAPRVLFVTHNAPRHDGDAAGSFVLRLAVALQERGTTVDVLAPGAAGLAPSTRLHGVAMTRVRYASDSRMTLAYEGTMVETVRRSWSGKLALLQLLWALRRATRRALDAASAEGRPYTAVHVHWWFPAGLALWRMRGRGDPPLVITMHGSDVRLAAMLRAAHPIMRGILREAAVLTTVSSWLANTVRAIMPTAAVQVAPMPIELADLGAEAEVEVARGAESRAGILFVGRLNAQKGVADLLEAMARPALAAVTVSIIGDGPDRAPLQARAHALGVADRVRWLGHRPHQELASFYRAARVVAMPSRGEGLGLVAVEAQCHGTPVVAYADAGVMDVVDPALGNRLVPPGDIEGLASALAALIARDAREVAEDMAVARIGLQARFAPSAVAARYQALYSAAGALERRA